MATVAEILNAKGHEIWSIAPDATVFEALSRMAEKDVGALVVLAGPRLVGILSERDYARKVILRGRLSKDTCVGDIMTKQVYTATPEQTIEACMALMTARHVRHLPVLMGDRLVGVVSIGDVVKAKISEQEFMIQQLEKYITGS